VSAILEFVHFILAQSLARKKGGFMTFPESFSTLKRRAHALLEAYRKRAMSDSELNDTLIDLCVDNRCERLPPGYDGATHDYYAVDATVASLGVPMFPTKEDVSGAIAHLNELVCDVCFADPPAVYRANYFGVLLTPLVRLMIDDNLPLIAIDATKPRSGKGLLAAIVGILANGYPTPVTTGPEPKEAGEWRKKLTTFLLAGENIVTIDNVVFSLNSAELCALVTTRNYTDRILGSNTSMTADPLNSMWIFTGNALQPVGDLVKRCFWVRLDPQRSDPEKRTGFRHEELLRWVAANRASFLRALLTLVRFWVVAGQPEPKGIAPFGGFDRWLRVVGGTLQCAGIQEFFQDPEQAYSDPDAEQWLPFLCAVGEVTYWDKFTTAEISTVAQDVQWVAGRNIPSKNANKLRDHLPDELAREIDTARFRAALGYAFRKKKNTYYGSDNIHIATPVTRPETGQPSGRCAGATRPNRLQRLRHHHRRHHRHHQLHRPHPHQQQHQHRRNPRRPR
jgi:hypothetical protein